MPIISIIVQDYFPSKKSNPGVANKIIGVILI